MGGSMNNPNNPSGPTNPSNPESGSTNPGGNDPYVR
jgi:hypothetical protein